MASPPFLLMNIVAFDPGQTTGFCHLDASQNGFRVVRALEIPWNSRFGMIKALVAGTYELSPDSLPQRPDAIIIERFQLYPGRAHSQIGSEFPSAQVTGIIGAFAFSEGLINHIIYQPPSFMSRVKILEQHEHLLTGSEHKKDAYKHARYYYIVNKYT